ARRHHVHALGKQLRRAGAADATARAGDDGDAVFEAEVQALLRELWPSCPRMRASTPSFAKTWMAGTGPAMTNASAGVFEDVHARAGAVDEVEQSVVVAADVVRLHSLPVAGELRHVAADLLRTQGIAHVDGAQAGVEVGEEDEVRPRAFAADV